jgi:hypothetical protein
LSVVFEGYCRVSLISIDFSIDTNSDFPKFFSTTENTIHNISESKSPSGLQDEEFITILDFDIHYFNFFFCFS